MSNPGSAEQQQDVIDRLQGEVAELRRSRRRLVQAASADRQAIERAFHNGVQQHLVALATDVRRVVGLLDGDPSAAKAILDDMATGIRDALTEATDLAALIRPPLLDVRGLASAIRLAAGRRDLTIVVEGQPDADDPAEIVEAVYWSCLEALSLGSPVFQARIRVRHADQGLSFEVTITKQRDDGSLVRLRDRVEGLDGRVSVVEGPDGNDRLYGWLPLSG